MTFARATPPTTTGMPHSAGAGKQPTTRHSGGIKAPVLLTRLELFLRRTGLKPTEVARLAGYSRQHFLRLRLGESDATRGGIVATVGACRKLSRGRVTPELLFERAELFLRGAGQRLSHAHAADRRRLDGALAGSPTPDLSDAIMASGIGSETAVRHLLTAAKARLDTQPARAATIYDAAGRLAAALTKDGAGACRLAPRPRAQRTVERTADDRRLR